MKRRSSKSQSRFDWYGLSQRFSIRKYHFGAASVLLGAALVFGGEAVRADEVPEDSTVAEVVLVAEQPEITLLDEVTEDNTEVVEEVTEVVEKVAEVASETTEVTEELAEPSSALEEVAEATPESEAGEIAELAEVTSPEITAPVVETPAPAAEEATQEEPVKVKPVAKAEQTFSWQAVPAAPELLENAAELEAAGAVISYLNGAPTFGQTVAKVLLTYADGTTEIVDVPVKISSAAVRKETAEEAEKLEEGTGFRAVYSENEEEGTTTWVEKNFQGNIKHANSTESDKVEDFIESTWEAVDTDADGINDTINWTHVFNKGLMNRNQYAYYFTVPDVVGPVTDLKVVQTHRDGRILNTSDISAFDRDIREVDEGPIVVGNGNNIKTGEYEIRKISEGTGNKTAAVYANKDFLHSSLDRTESPVSKDNLQDDYYVIYSNRGINAHSYWTVTYSTKINDAENLTDQKLSYIIGSNGSTTTEHADMAIGIHDVLLTDMTEEPVDLIEEYDLKWKNMDKEGNDSVAGRNDVGFTWSEDGKSIVYYYDVDDPNPLNLANILEQLQATGKNENTRTLNPKETETGYEVEKYVAERGQGSGYRFDATTGRYFLNDKNIEVLDVIQPDTGFGGEPVRHRDGSSSYTYDIDERNGAAAFTITDAPLAENQELVDGTIDRNQIFSTKRIAYMEYDQATRDTTTDVVNIYTVGYRTLNEKPVVEVPADGKTTAVNQPVDLTTAVVVTDKEDDADPADDKTTTVTYIVKDENGTPIKTLTPEEAATYTPDAEGNYTVDVKATDSKGDVTTQSFPLVVTPKPDTTAPTLKDPAKTPVADPTKLTDEEKAKVADEVKKANPDLPADAEITVGNDGAVTVKVPGKDEATLTPDKTVTEKPADTTAPTLKDPAKTPVADKTNLTDDEKAKVAEEVKKANPDLPADATIEVGNDGTVTVTVPGKDPATLTPAQTVTEKPADTTAPAVKE
ncbi:YSIRK-type signal peptide-containing protein, partial [Streptococcus pluranimalium]|uniref:YSIRK-type signal peptide-containing protein n=1 Tax=Streptococcus pluranimalium TaxID=82348 RepID=UPI004046DC8D